MRPLFSLVLAIFVAGSALLVTGVDTAYAAYHCMRIHAVMSGFSGNNNIQYVELRLDNAGHRFVATHQIQFFDSTGTLKNTFTFPADVALPGDLGASILIATAEFNSNVTGGAADFTFSGANTTGVDPLHPVQPGNGSVVWAGPSTPGGTSPCFNGGVPPVDSVAYGTAAATFGAAAPALPNPGTTQALRLSNINTLPSNNLAEYSPLQNVSTSTFSVAVVDLPTNFTTPRNYGRTVLKLNAPPPPSVGGIVDAPGAAQNAVTDAGGDRDGRDRMVYGFAAVAAASVAAGGGWYVYRRRATGGP